MTVSLAAAQTAPTANPTTTATSPTTMTPATMTPAEAAASTSLTLEQAITLLELSPAVQQSKLSVQAAQARFDAARAILGLTVSGVGSANYSGSYNATTATGTTTTVDSTLGGTAGVNVSLGVFPWSSNQTSLHSAQWALTYAQALLASANNSAKLNVAQQYYNGMLAAYDTQLASSALALAQRQLSIVQTQKASGNATEQSLLAAQAAVQSAQAQQTQAQANLQQASLSLAAALGLTNVATTFPTQPPENTDLPDVEALVKQARTQRTEVVKAQSDLSAAQDALTQAEINARIPNVTASVGYGPSSNTGLSASLNVQQGTVSASYLKPWGSSSNNLPADHLTAGVSGSFVIYSPALRAQIAAAQAAVTQSQLTVSVQQQTIELDVRTKYNTLVTARNAVQTQAAQVQVARAGLTAAQASLSAGTGTKDGVQQAQQTLEQAKRTLISNRVAAQLALFNLLAASGGSS